MTEKYIQGELEGLSERELLESMTQDQIVDYILHMGRNVSDLEKKMNLASEVLEGVYGTDVEQILTERGTMLATFVDGETKNGATE